MDLLSKDGVLALLKEHGVWSKKKLGQHFLIDESALEAIVEKADIKPDDIVVEIGPGPGALSRQLLAKAGRVIAFEFDPDMVGILHKTLPELEVVQGDVLKTAPNAIPEIGTYKIVANIPYQITTPLLRLFLEDGVSPRPTSMTLLVQKEVGKRLAAKAAQPDRGYLSVLCEYFATIEYVRDVPASSFWPAPEVNSGVIHLQLKTETLYEEAETQSFLRFVHRHFIQPRKQLKNVIAGIQGVSTDVAEEVFEKLGWPSTVRAQELSLDQWSTLYAYYR